MASLEIGRLTVEMPGLAADEGQRLAEMIGRRLAEARWAPARHPDHVGITIAQGQESLERLADLIADEMQRRLT
jgi:hypothetical protein